MPVKLFLKYSCAVFCFVLRFTLSFVILSAGVFDHLKRWKASMKTRSSLTILGPCLHSTVTRATTKQWVTWTNGWSDWVVNTKEIIRQQTLWQLEKSGQIWFKSIRHNMEMALISFSPSRKSLPILQRLGSYWPMPSLSIKKQHGWS